LSLRILLFNAKRKKCVSTSPHVGLAMIAAVLRQKGHNVMVVDYQFIHRAPAPDFFMKNFKPDVIGITLYTATMREAEYIIERVCEAGVPIVVGGPHATLYADELIKDKRLSCVVKGQAEDVVCSVFEEYAHGAKNRIIESSFSDVTVLPTADFTCFYSFRTTRCYPLLTSRGCPFNCSFCAVALLSGRTWRPRDPGLCIEELKQAKRTMPNIKSMVIYDDHPMFDKKHIVDFLDLYMKEAIGLPFTVINVRADSLDEEMVGLLKRAGCTSIALGVEHGDPEVFRMVNKQESLEDIERAARIIKKHGLPLYLCFVIGLEGDSLEKTKASIEFAKRLGPTHIYWNMANPFKGTRLRQWYEKEGTIFDLVNHSSWVDADFICDEPRAQTPDFSVEERKKAYYSAIMETNDLRLRSIDFSRLLPYVSRYNLWKEYRHWLLNKFKNLLRGRFL